MYAAEAVDHALLIYDFDDQRVLLANHGTDTGGGGTQTDLFLKLCEVNRVMTLLEYIYPTCALHGLNLCLSLWPSETLFLEQFYPLGHLPIVETG